MDLHLKQWRNQDESDPQKQQQRKCPKLLLDLDQHQHQNQSQQQSGEQQFRLLPSNSNFGLSLFGPDQHSIPTTTNLSEQVIDSANSGKFSRGSSFSSVQRQELETQALIYRYMLAGVAVPPELLQHLKSLHHFRSSPFFLTHPLNQYSMYQPALLQPGYWGKAEMDPEPGRCRRTDGKKWRCSREVVAGQKYCERHVHRGRNRSRKPVEVATSTSSTAPFLTADTAAPITSVSIMSSSSSMAAPLSTTTDSLSLCGLSAIDLLHLNHSTVGTRSSGPKMSLSDGHLGFDDWPKSVDSDVALKLGIGPGEELREHLGWAPGWTSTTQLPSMGGPLAALRSSASNFSPTSVLNYLSRGSASETTSYASS